MQAPARSLHLRRPALVAVLAVLVATTVAAPQPAAAALAIRLEAGPQTGVTFSSSWRITSRLTATLAAPVTVTGSSRRTEPPGGTWLKVTGGVLAGRWVRESSVAYVAGIAGTAAYAPARSLRLEAGRWELYRFDESGIMTAASGWSTQAATTVRIDRTSVLRGRRHMRVADGAWAGWWIPGSLASPQRITCSAGSPPSSSTKVVVRSVPEASGEIALTFDMGGRTTPALSIVRYLELARVCATIFPTGTTAATEAGRAVMAEIRAHPELFEVGNHTVHHCNLRDGGGGASCPADRPDAASVTAELAGADAIIAPLAGSHTTPYWRPPYGASDSALRTVAAAAGYPYTVLWSTDTIDWRQVKDGGPTAAQTAAKVIAGRKPGAVVLMHLGGYTTRDALPAMIAGLRAAGYRPTTVSALFR
jgi:peptidoglycan/xylan/chitin deacetylase (PgdA/CDA1 family)